MPEIVREHDTRKYNDSCQYEHDNRRSISIQVQILEVVSSTRTRQTGQLMLGKEGGKEGVMLQATGVVVGGGGYYRSNWYVVYRRVMRLLSTPSRCTSEVLVLLLLYLRVINNML